MSKSLEEQLEISEKKFAALVEFCETELEWMYFRAEFLNNKKDSPSQTIKNARKLKEYIASLNN